MLLLDNILHDVNGYIYRKELPMDRWYKVLLVRFFYEITTPWC